MQVSKDLILENFHVGHNFGPVLVNTANIYGKNVHPKCILYGIWTHSQQQKHQWGGSKDG